MNENKKQAPSMQGAPASRYASVGWTVAPRGEVSWHHMPPQVVYNLVRFVTAAGDAVLLGNTKQGGLSVTIYNEGAPIKIYSSSIEDMTRKCEEATAIARLVVPAEVLQKMDKL
jgi:hypothetical protein